MIYSNSIKIVETLNLDVPEMGKEMIQKVRFSN